MTVFVCMCALLCVCVRARARVCHAFPGVFVLVPVESVLQFRPTFAHMVQEVPGAAAAAEAAPPPPEPALERLQAQFLRKDTKARTAPRAPLYQHHIAGIKEDAFVELEMADPAAPFDGLLSPPPVA